MSDVLADYAGLALFSFRSASAFKKNLASHGAEGVNGSLGVSLASPKKY